MRPNKNKCALGNRSENLGRGGTNNFFKTIFFLKCIKLYIDTVKSGWPIVHVVYFEGSQIMISLKYCISFSDRSCLIPLFHTGHESPESPQIDCFLIRGGFVSFH